MKIKKVLAGIVGIGLIILLLIFVNSLVGNPVSKLLAKNAAGKYMEENYDSLDLQIESSNYNFKDGKYFVFVRSASSYDTAFSIYVDSFGNVTNDNYEYEVANNFTTWRRLDEEMREMAKEVIIAKLDYDFDSAFLRFGEEQKDNLDLMKLERDMKLDIHNPPLPLEADVTVFSGDVSYVKIAEIAKALDKTLKEQNISVAQCSVMILPMANKPEGEDRALSWADAISVSYFPAERMNEEDLPKVMEQFETDRVAEYEKEHAK